ncbi:MAG: 50S ribosomal protein L25 [Dehalococcoidia bacterium]|nr:50S ribosomal protein L25 [Dehalococcoidia bacterium]
MTSANGSTLTLEGERREALGRHVKALRRDGITPANLYGRGADSISFQAETRALDKLVTDGGRGSLVELTIDGERHQTLLRGLQRHPVTRAILHADFYIVEMNRPVQTTVPVHLVGDAPAARLPGAVITHLTHEVTIECLPANIPAAIELDVTILEELETSLHVSDITAPAGVEILTDSETIIVRATHSRVAATIEAEDAEAAEEEAEAAEGAPAEATAPAEDSSGDE